MRSGEKVFVDTGAWIALAIVRDPLHVRAREHWETMQEAGARLHTSVAIVLETYTYLDRKGSRELASSWRTGLAQVPKLRLIITTLFVVFAVLLARYSWGFPSAPHATSNGERVWVPPIAIDAERALYDTRSLYAALRHPVAQDERIIMVVYTQETLAATAKRSPLDRTILAKALTSIDALGPKAIGIDILIDQPQPEDETLLAAFRTMKTPVWLA